MLGNSRQPWIPGCGFWFRGNARFGFLVSGTWIPDSLIWITDSKAEGSEIHQQTLPRIPESGWPYRARLCICSISTLRKSSNITDFQYLHKKLTWRNYRLIFYNAVTYRLQLVGIFWYIRLMLFDDEKVLGFFEIQFVGSPRSPPLTSSLRSVLSLKSSLIILTPVTPIQCCNTNYYPHEYSRLYSTLGQWRGEQEKKRYKK